MPTLSPKTTPYYGGGQAVNPANVLQVSSAPSSTLTQDKLGTIAIVNSTGAAYLLVSKSGGTNTWALLESSGGAGNFSTVTSAGTITATNGNLVLGTAGNKLNITTGSNASVGVTAAMSGTPGAVTVSTTACTASSVILFSRATTGGTPGQVSVTAQSTSGFTLTSTGNETSTFNYLIIN